MNRIKALYRSWAIPCSGTTVYAPRHRAEWLAKLVEPGVRIRAERLYQQLDVLQPVRQQARHDLLLESHKHSAVKLLRQIPSIGPIRAALLVALLQTPHRFRTKRQLWAYSGFAVETHDSGEYRWVRGKLQRNRERMTVRGLNNNHNKDLKSLFKSAAISASTRPGPLQDFYVALVGKGIRPTMARLTLARKIAAITLAMWKKGVSFDPQQVIGRSPSQSGATRELSRRCPSCSCHELVYRTWNHSSAQTSERLSSQILRQFELSNTESKRNTARRIRAAQTCLSTSVCAQLAFPWR